MDILEIDFSSQKNGVAPMIITLNGTCFRLSAKYCPSVKWTCKSCTTMCTFFCGTLTAEADSDSDVKCA